MQAFYVLTEKGISECKFWIKSMLEEGHYFNNPTAVEEFKEACWLPIDSFKKIAGSQLHEGWLFYSSNAGNWFAINEETGEARSGGTRHGLVLPTTPKEVMRYSYPNGTTWTPGLKPWENLTSDENEILHALRKTGLMKKAKEGMISPKVVADYGLPKVPARNFHQLALKIQA